MTGAATERATVARLLAQVAAGLDERRAGIVRQAVHLLLEVPDHATAGDTCAGCGAELDQPATGRPRKWCSERCRRRHRP